MKTRITLIAAAIMLSCSSLMAQGLLGAIASGTNAANGAASGVSGAAGSVGNAAGAVGQAAGAVNQLKGLFGGKKKKEAEAAAAAAAAAATQLANTAVANAATALPAGIKVTTVTVTGIDYATLKKFNEAIQACGTVTETKMKFNSTASTIEVMHKESTDNLLKLMGETSKDIFSDKNIEGIEDGKIALKLK
ncbi:hypothetical protein ACFQZS_10870 [Mucilaginibacter calamicampi]|uniref:Uncharacterized protein n=1 Tax=Mucilaginibacter calamicampi TaxID=1302352 RepID=A0ABW2YZJ3_9SPHI